MFASESEYLIAQGLFIKGVALTFFLAFTSLFIQIKGLYGTNGISPIKQQLDALKSKYPLKKLWADMPTVFWLGASDNALRGIGIAGVLCSLLAFFGIYPAIFLFLLVLFYTSFCSVGSPFLNYQWDILLIEIGFMSGLLAIQTPPSPFLIYLLWFLLFKFMLSSGLTKLLYGSQEWRDLTAMKYHYETQPLPTVLGYAAHHFPTMIAKASVLGVHFLEVAVPFTIFTPLPFRLIAFCLLVFLQILIMLTGNYAFFNLLTIFMCIPLLPDPLLQDFSPLSSFVPLVGPNQWVEAALSLSAISFILLNAVELCTTFVNVGGLHRFVYPFRKYNLINSYGLFVHLTTERDEIIIEGSEDGVIWLPYEFIWKPGDIRQKPRLAAPHQPRLDWQMWFASLSVYQRNPWFIQFLTRLLEGSRDVAGLLRTNPFPDYPPKYIRSLRYRYHFTGLKTKMKTGEWWKRELIGEYSPAMSLKDKP